MYILTETERRWDYLYNKVQKKCHKLFEWPLKSRNRTRNFLFFMWCDMEKKFWNLLPKKIFFDVCFMNEHQDDSILQKLLIKKLHSDVKLPLNSKSNKESIIIRTTFAINVWEIGSSKICCEKKNTKMTEGSSINDVTVLGGGAGSRIFLLKCKVINSVTLGAGPY